MRIVEIITLENGAHRNQSSNSTVIPKGWAVIPENMEIPNFPFGNVTAEEINGVMTVTKWEAGAIPVVAKEPSTVEQLRADIDYIAIMTEVEL